MAAPVCHGTYHVPECFDAEEVFSDGVGVVVCVGVSIESEAREKRKAGSVDDEIRDEDATRDDDVQDAENGEGRTHCACVVRVIRKWTTRQYNVIQ